MEDWLRHQLYSWSPPRPRGFHRGPPGRHPPLPADRLQTRAGRVSVTVTRLAGGMKRGWRRRRTAVPGIELRGLLALLVRGGLCCVDGRPLTPTLSPRTGERGEITDTVSSDTSSLRGPGLFAPRARCRRAYPGAVARRFLAVWRARCWRCGAGGGRWGQTRACRGRRRSRWGRPAGAAGVRQRPDRDRRYCTSPRDGARVGTGAGAGDAVSPGRLHPPGARRAAGAGTELRAGRGRVAAAQALEG